MMSWFPFERRGKVAENLMFGWMGRELQLGWAGTACSLPFCESILYMMITISRMMMIMLMERGGQPAGHLFLSTHHSRKPLPSHQSTNWTTQRFTFLPALPPWFLPKKQLYSPFILHTMFVGVYCLSSTKVAAFNWHGFIWEPTIFTINQWTVHDKSSAYT